jgi:hypothetical protein
MIESKKIVVVVDSIDVNDSSGSKANVALIENLQKIGCKLLVLHYTQKNIQLNAIECISIPEKKWNLLFLLSRMQRYFTRFTAIHLNKFVENVLGFSFVFLNDSNSISSGIKDKRVKSFNPDIVLTLSKGASFRSHHAMLKVPDYHSKWLAYIHDPYPFHYYPSPYNWTEPGYKQKIKFFNQLENKARWIGFPSVLLMEWMTRFFPKMEEKGIIIPHQNANIQLTDELPDFFDSSKFNLLHAGALMKQRDPKYLIEGYLLFLEKNQLAKNHARLLLLGNNSHHEEFLDTFTSFSTICLSTYLPYQVSQNLQHAVAVNIILEAIAEVSPFLPGKFPHCVQADKPILLLAPQKSETKRLLGNDYPYWSEADDVLKIADNIQKLYENWLIKPERLDRTDLIDYCDTPNLKKIMRTLT